MQIKFQSFDRWISPSFAKDELENKNKKMSCVTYNINEQVFTCRSNKISSVIEANCPDRPSEKHNKKHNQYED